MARLFLQTLGRLFARLGARCDPSLRGVAGFPAGSFYSPLLDLDALEKEPASFLRNSQRAWDNLDLRPAEQRALLEEFCAAPTGLPLAAEPSPAWRYHTANEYFVFSDAWILSQMLARFRPRRVVEVGSGFSSAVMLDTRDHLKLPLELVFIEPYPERLQSILRPEDRQSTRILVEKIQDVPLEEFTALEAGDFLFIDSSHIAKVGSDLADVFARILPALRPGVFIHFHDVFYPGPYPLAWLKQGRAWNEVLFLQTFLQFNDAFRVVLFNAQIAVQERTLLAARCPRFLENSGGSFWLRRIG